MLTSIKSKESGFTLVELIIAIALFSMGFLVITVGFVALMQFYQVGNDSRIVQTAARMGIDSIAQAARQGDWLAYNDGLSGSSPAVCIHSINATKGTTGTVVYYIDTTTYALMEEPWDSSLNCSKTSIMSGGVASRVTSSDVEVVKLIPEQSDNFVPGGSVPYSTTWATPCDAAGVCSGTKIHASMRVTIVVTNNHQVLDAAQRNCKPGVVECTVTALSTTLTPGGNVLP